LGFIDIEAYSGGGGGVDPQNPPFLRKFFQFARVFQEKNAKTPPKFSRPYKKFLKPLPQKISGYAPVLIDMEFQTKKHIVWVKEFLNV